MQPPKSLENVALFGLGEAGTLIAIDLQKAGISVTAYDPKDIPTPAGVDRVHTPQEAVATAEVRRGRKACDHEQTDIDQKITAIPSKELEEE